MTHEQRHKPNLEGWLNLGNLSYTFWCLKNRCLHTLSFCLFLAVLYVLQHTWWKVTTQCIWHSIVT